MITTGVIKDLSKDRSTCSVDISIFKNVSNVNSPENKLTGSIYEATIAVPPGIVSAYNINDKVYVDFVNNQTSYPVVVGKIYEGLENSKQSAFGSFESLSVSGKSSLSKDTVVEDLNVYNELATVKRFLENEKDKRVCVHQLVLSGTGLRANVQFINNSIDEVDSYDKLLTLMQSVPNIQYLATGVYSGKIVRAIQWNVSANNLRLLLVTLEGGGDVVVLNTITDLSVSDSVIVVSL